MRSSPGTAAGVTTSTAVAALERSCANDPVKTARPARTTVSRSHRVSTSARMWLESRTEVPAAARSVTTAWKTASMRGSSPEVGSSRTSSSTSQARAATSATFWRLPLE